MKSFVKWFLLVAALVVAAGVIAILVLRDRAAREARMEAEVYYCTSSTEWWDTNQTEAANSRQRELKVRTLGNTALTILTRDLHYDPVRLKLLDKLPFLDRFIHRPMLHESPEQIRIRAASNLGDMGMDAKSSVPSLLPLLKDPNSMVRVITALALGRIGFDSPQARRGLTEALNDSDSSVQFAAAFSLWSFDRANQTSIDRVNGMISAANLAWPSICLIQFGKGGSVFAPRIKQLIAGMPWSYNRVQAVHAVWSVTGDRQFVRREIESLAIALETPSTRNPTSGWTPAEDALAYMMHRLDDEKEFRDQLRPLMQRILDDPKSPAHRAAQVYTSKFEQFDRRELGGK